MAGGNPHKGSSHKHNSSSSSSHRKSRWESGSGHNQPAADRKLSTADTAGRGGGGNSKQPTPNHSANPTDKPTPKSGPNPSPSHAKPPSDLSGPGPISNGPFADGLGPPPPPAYGFHMLDRRTIVLADGSVRSYFALPPDYQDFVPPRRPGPELAGLGPGFDKRFPPLGPMSPEFRDMGDPYLRDRDRGHEFWNPLGKRKFGDEGERGRRDERELGIEGRDEFARQRQQLLQFGNAGLNPNGFPGGEFSAGPSNPHTRDMVGFGGGEDLRMAKHMRVAGYYQSLHENVGLKHNEVDQSALKKAFLHFVKLINENVNQKENYLENGKRAPLQCVACGRSSRDFPDMHALIMHTYSPDRLDLLLDHLGLHKALCILMGWNYSKPPDNSKTYQSLSADEAAANQDDLIMWPPMGIIHNTITGKGKEGRMEGLGNKAMDAKLRELGFGSGKAKSVYGKEGHLGITLVKFSADQSGLKEALRFKVFFEKENRGRKKWTQVQSLSVGKDDENNPNLMEVDKKTGEKKRIFYGYLGTVFDLYKVDFETRKKVVIESIREYNSSK